MINNEELPIGFTMALAQNSDALVYFSQLPDERKEQVVDGARQVDSREEMRAYVDNLHQYDRFY